MGQPHAQPFTAGMGKIPPSLKQKGETQAAGGAIAGTELAPIPSKDQQHNPGGNVRVFR